MLPIKNRSRIRDAITGINGVAAGAKALLTLPPNTRYHGLEFQTSKVNYTNPVVAIPTGAGAGDGNAALSATVVNGVITAINIDAAGATYTNGTFDLDDFVTDPTGEGFSGTITVSGGAITATSVTSGGTPSFANPADVLDSLTVKVNGVSMRDIAPASLLRIPVANGMNLRRGQLPLFFSEPWRKSQPNPDFLSWDLFGQDSFEVTFGIKSTAVNPQIIGVKEYDYVRNLVNENGVDVPFLNPVAYHEYGISLPAGRYEVNTLPFDFPILRMWIVAPNAASISRVEVKQDNNLVVDMTREQMIQEYGDYGITFGKADYLNQSWSGSNTLQDQYLQPIYFDSGYLSDPDNRWSKALKAINQMLLTLTSDVAQNITVVMETLPGQYA